MSDDKTIDVYNARAADYAQMTESTEPDKRLIDFIERLPQGAHVLDLGCGPGNAAKAMGDAGCTALAWDASSEMVALAQGHDQVTAEQKVFADLETLETDSLHGVWASFSLLHAPRDDVPGHIADIARAVKSGGIFLIAVKTGTGEERDSIGRLYTYFQEDELETLLSNAGFRIVRRDHGREPGLSGEEADWVSLTTERL